MDDEISLDDVLQYQNLFTLAPSFVLERMAKRNSNLVSKFKSTIESHITSLDEVQKNKLDIILNSDVGDLQALMNEAYIKTNKKQYKVLANPKYREFVENNIEELKKLNKEY